MKTFKEGDRVFMITLSNYKLLNYQPATVVKVYKNGIYKVLPDNRRHDNCYYKFRPNGDQVGTTWLDFVKTIIDDDWKKYEKY